MKLDVLLRRFLLILLAALFLAGCDDTEDGAENLEEAPEVFLVQGDSMIAPSERTSCWPEREDGLVDSDEYADLTEICEDTALPEFTGASTTSLAAGEAIQIQLEEPLPDRVDLALSYPDSILTAELDSTQTITDETITWEPGVPVGDYVLIVLGYWRDQGGATYYFPITIE